MSPETRTQPCLECGWPALTGTRRCPFCRTELPRPARVHSLDWQTVPLGWLAAGWFGLMAGFVVVSLIVIGWQLALLIALASLGPVGFALLLRQRSLARIRGLTPRRADDPGRSPRRSTPPPSRSSDISKN